MNKAACIVWFDSDNRDSYKLCLEQYGLKCLLAKDIDADNVEIVVYGLAENIDNFKTDADEGACEPLESMSRSLEFDEDYEGWLNNEIYWFDRFAEEAEAMA